MDFGKIFGKIEPPDKLRPFTDASPTGEAGISKFLSNFVILIYTIAFIALVFMLFWGAYDWIISEGDKEKVQQAQKKIINAIIGIALFAAAFAVLQVLGDFTGFKFFAQQK